MERRYIDRVIFSRPLEGETYLSSLPVVRHLKQNGHLSFDRDVTFLVGENGTGKSTLLEAIAVAYGFNPEGGSKNYRFSTQATHSGLHRSLTLSRSRYAKDGFFLRAESFYNAASYLDELDSQPAFQPPLTQNYGGISMHRKAMERAFWHWYKIVLAATGSICSTNRKPHFLQPGCLP